MGKNTIGVISVDGTPAEAISDHCKRRFHAWIQANAEKHSIASVPKYNAMQERYVCTKTTGETTLVTLSIIDLLR